MGHPIDNAPLKLKLTDSSAFKLSSPERVGKTSNGFQVCIVSTVRRKPKGSPAPATLAVHEKRILAVQDLHAAATFWFRETFKNYTNLLSLSKISCMQEAQGESSSR